MVLHKLGSVSNSGGVQQQHTVITAFSVLLRHRQVCTIHSTYYEVWLVLSWDCLRGGTQGLLVMVATVPCCTGITLDAETITTGFTRPPRAPGCGSDVAYWVGTRGTEL